MSLSLMNPVNTTRTELLPTPDQQVQHAHFPESCKVFILAQLIISALILYNLVIILVSFRKKFCKFDSVT